MEAIKLRHQAPQNQSAIDAKIFLTDLGKKRFKKRFQIYGANENQILAIANHIKNFSITEKGLVMPDKGLVLIANNEKYIYPIFQLIVQYINELFQSHKERHGTDSFYSHCYPSSKFYFADAFNLMLINRNPNEILEPILNQLNILFIGELTQELEVKLSNYNKFDAIPFILKERQFRHRFVSSSLTYFSMTRRECDFQKVKGVKESDLIFNAIGKRYDQTFLDSLVDYCELIIFNDTLKIEYL